MEQQEKQVSGKVRIGRQLIGYQPDMRQWSRRVALVMAMPASFDTDAADGLLNEVMGVDAEKELARWIERRGPCRAPGTLQSLLPRMAILARALLRAVRLPAFEEPVIAVRPQQGEERLAVTLFMPAVAGFDTSVYGIAVRHARALLLLSQHAGPGSPQLAAALDQLHEDFIVAGGGDHTASLSIIPLMAAAFAADIPFMHLGGSLYQLGWGCRARLYQNSSTDRDAAIGARLAQYKHRCVRLLRAAGFPVPEGRAVTTLEGAMATAEVLSFPVVVKPVDRERGEGVTIAIASADELKAAFEHASTYGATCLVERHIPGVCHRIAVVDGKVAYAYRRDPKSLLGDGEQSVAELARQATATENRKARHLRSRPCELDELALKCLRERGMTAESIPAEGEWVPIKPTQSVAWGGRYTTVTSELHPDNAHLAIQAAALLRLDSAGIDLMITDCARPWHEVSGMIIEVNYSPQIGENTSTPHMEAVAGAGDVRIPVEVFLGNGDALAAARERQATLSAGGERAWLTSHELTAGPGHGITANASSLLDRTRALLLRPDVGRLILVVQTDEAVSCGFPVDRICALTTVNLRLQRRDGKAAASVATCQQIARYLAALAGPNAGAHLAITAERPPGHDERPAGR